MNKTSITRFTEKVEQWSAVELWNYSINATRQREGGRENPNNDLPRRNPSCRPPNKIQRNDTAGSMKTKSSALVELDAAAAASNSDATSELISGPRVVFVIDMYGSDEEVGEQLHKSWKNKLSNGTLNGFSQGNSG